jgi:ParB-like chromosome segregation protein Spo0J
VALLILRFQSKSTSTRNLPARRLRASVWSILANFHINGSQELKQGDIVTHLTFGRGIILNHWAGDADVLEVQFDDGTHSVNRCRLILAESAAMVNPAAEKFPKLSRADYEALKESIRVYGQFEPVVVDLTGKVLDGRHRVQACRELGITPRTVCIEELKAQSPHPLSEVQFIRDSNIERRHLTQSQKAAMVLEFLPLVRQEAAARRRSAQDKGRETKANGSAKLSTATMLARRNGTTNAVLAKRAGVGVITMTQVVAVADHRPDLVPEITNGSISAKAAAKLVKKKTSETNGANGDGPLREDVLHRWGKVFVGFINGYPEQQRKVVREIVMSHLTGAH